MGRRVTIEMVAKEAGVSRGTVDRVINQRPHVREQQRISVLNAIEKLGYEPKTRQAKALGLELKEEEICRFGFILPKRNEYFLKELQRGIADGQAQIVDYRIAVLTRQCLTPFPEETIEKIDDLVREGVKGLVLSPIQSELVEDKIRELKEKNIPVITIDNDIGTDRLQFYGKNPIRSGNVAACLMAKSVPSDASLLIGIGSREMEEHQIRLDAFLSKMKELQKGPESRFCVIETYGDYNITYKKVKDALKKYPDIKGIYMANHSLTGCMDAIRVTERARDVCVISGDITERTVHYLKEGELDYCVTPNIYMQGYQPLLVLKEYLLDGITPGANSLHTTTDIICKENVEE